ncbi:MAG: hypothetical protein ACP5OC_00450 [Thermoplasmata archaeon]
MPDPLPAPDEFDAESKAYFGNLESKATRNTKGVVKQDAVVADIRSLMSRGKRGYYLVKSYALDEMKEILFESCKQLNSMGLRPELVPNLEKALQKNESGEPKIRVITEDYIDFSNAKNKETVAQIINGNAGLHLDGVFLVIGLAEQTYRKLANSSRELQVSGGNTPKFYELINANSGTHRYYTAAIIVTLLFGLTYTFYASKLFSAGFESLAITFIVLWFLVPFIFFILVKKELGHRQLYVLPLIAAFLATLISGGIQGSSLSSSGPFIYYGYPFLYYDYYQAQVPRGALFTPNYLVFGFSWPGLFLDLIAWFCISIIATVIAATIWSKYGGKMTSKTSSLI